MDSIRDILERGSDVLVANDEMISVLNTEQVSSKDELLYCNYYDFIEFIAANKYFVSGSVVVYFPSDNMVQKKILNIIENCIKKYEITFLLFSEEDYYLPFKNKNLSETIVQHCKQE